MSVPKNIKRFWMWVGIALLIELAAITLWKRWYWFFPSYSVSELYTKYAGTEGLDVAFVKDYRVNDTVFVDVTLLEATTDSAWNGLVKEFNFGDQFNAELPSDTNAVSFWFAPRNHYNLPMDSTLLNNDIVVASQYRKTMAVFHITSEDQVNAIVFRQIVNVKPQNQHP